MKILLIILTIFLTSCKLNKIVNNHGVHNLEIKGKKLLISKSNINDIKMLLGPPSTKSYFDNDVYIYIERKTSSSKLIKLGKKNLIINNVLILDINNKGILISKKFYNKDDMNKVKFEEDVTTADHSRRSFVYNFFYTLRQKIDDPRGIKRSTN